LLSLHDRVWSSMANVSSFLGCIGYFDPTRKLACTLAPDAAKQRSGESNCGML
jgi:hypothetical protein